MSVDEKADLSSDKQPDVPPRSGRLPYDPIEAAREQWTQQGWEAADEMTAATSIIRAQQIVVSRMHAILRPRGLSFARFELLVLLYLTRRGTLPLGKVSARLMAHPTSVTNLVDRLEQDDLVTRLPSPTDRRTVFAAITAKGRTTVEEVAPLLGAARFGLGELGDGNREITDLIKSLRRSAGDFAG